MTTATAEAAAVATARGRKFAGSEAVNRLMPRWLIESVSTRLGFAPFPPGPLAEYLARSTSLLGP